MLKQFFSPAKTAPILTPNRAPMQPLKPSDLVSVVGGPVIKNGGGI
jgi:hypothetical protein